MARTTGLTAGATIQYYLKVDGVTGDSTVKGFEGWFTVDGFDLGVQNSSSIGSATGGAGAGKAQFSPLTVDIHSLAGLAPLLSDVTSGHHPASVELVGVETIKNQSIKAYDVKLSDVLVSSFNEDPGTNGVETALTFDFAKISLTDQPVTKTGTVGTPQTASWDVLQNKTAAAVSLPGDTLVTASMTEGGGSATSAPLTISLSDPPVHHQNLGSLIHQHAANLDLIEQLHAHAANPDLLLLPDPEGHDGSNTLSYSSPGIQDTALLATATHKMVEAMASFSRVGLPMMSCQRSTGAWLVRTIEPAS